MLSNGENMKFKYKKKSGALSAILLVIFAVLLAYSGTMLLKDFTQARAEKKEFEELADIIELEPDDTDTEKEPSDDTPTDVTEPDDNTPDGDTDEKPSAPKRKPLTRDIPKLVSMNPDCVGWVFVDGTPINYPVVHTPDEPEKYLRKSFYGKKSTGGVPFIDFRCTLDSSNIIIYGHGMRNGTMFGKLKYFVKKSFWEKHDIIEFETLDGCAKYKVFAVLEVKNDDTWYNKILLQTESSYNDAIEYAKSNSSYDTGYTPVFGQRLISLSTCYGETKADRLIVIGAEIE